MDTLLELKNISKAYFGVEVLSGVNVALHPGEVLCLVGENGAGKSTLIKIISGAIAPEGGEIVAFGQSLHRLHPKQAIAMGIATIYQDVDLVDNLTVADNIFLGDELRNSLGLIDAKRQEKQADELLDRLNLTKIRGSMMLDNLSTAQKQCVQIAKALKYDAKILILDEPTVSLGEEETQTLLTMVKNLAASGLGIIYISHYIDELFRVGDRLLILRDGQQVNIHQVATTTPEALIRDMIGRDASSFYTREHFPMGEDILEIRGFSDGKTVHDVGFTLRAGEIFGLGGLVGAGRTELVRMIYGCDRSEQGKLLLNGQDITAKTPKDAIRKGIFMISEDRKKEGLLTDRSVRENITVTHNERRELIDLKQEILDVDASIQQFRIKLSSREAPITTLSGGNQQKAIIARCVQDVGNIYIFDEPTKGVDIGAKEEIYAHILALAKEHKFVIIVSSDMPELISMSDRIGVMREGHLVDIVEQKNASEDVLLRKYLGLPDVATES